MTNDARSRLPKWPFLFADACLLAFALALVMLSSHPIGLWQIAACFGAVALGAVLTVAPWVLEHRAAAKGYESQKLASAMSQLQQLEQLAAQITGATARWQSAQEAADKTTNTARAIAEKINGEAEAFQRFLAKANESEKAHLRLELEKLQRAQGEWLQLTVHLLDHVFALHQAAVRSGQQNVITQLTQFQAVCRDMARRMGLVAFAPQAGEPFEEKLHQLADPKAKVPAGAAVAGTLGQGFNFQGQLLRKAVVELQALAAAEEQPDESQPALL